MKNLKNVVLAVAMGMISSYTLAQKGNDIPQSVINDFSSKYPGITVKNWKTKDNQYVASFKMNGRQCQAFYALNDEWLNTEITMRHLKNLSPVVRNAIRHSKYASYHIDDVKRLWTPHVEMFIVEVDNISGNKMLYDNIGSFDDQLLYFSHNGRLIKSVNNSNE
jgi:hypothetical protein